MSCNLFALYNIEVMESYQILKDWLGNNDKAAWEYLYGQYGRKFYSYCLQKWQLNEDEAWEVVYKTLETLVLKLSAYSFESPVQFDSFLFTVLINFLRQQYRSKKAREVADTVYVDFEAESGSQSGLIRQLNSSAIHSFISSEGIENTELVRLSKTLDSLEPVDKDLLLLRAQNYSYDQIAELLKIDNSQLKVRHHRAKKKLVDLLMQTTND